MVFDKVVVVLGLLAAIGQASYCPGTPGAEWTEDELKFYKEKIRWIIKKPEKALKLVPGGAEILEGYPGKNKRAIVPNLAKIVRLNFHDCVKQVNGEGCNGCLNFQFMGTKFSKTRCSKPGQNPNNCDTTDGGRPRALLENNNNNLVWVASVLEEVYKNKDFGIGNGNGKYRVSNSINQPALSLFEAGRSRADLWAFAGLVSVQKAAENHNTKCNPDEPKPCGNDINSSSPDCNYTLPEPVMQFGRVDCIPDCDGDNAAFGFCTTEVEIHANPSGNGQETVDYFHDSFGFNPRESAAILGGHTLGGPNTFNSLFSDDPWTPQGREDLNNFYYFNIAKRQNYRYLKLANDKTCGLKFSNFIGDEEGNPLDVGFKVSSEFRTQPHGPWDWAVFGQGCRRSVCDALPKPYAENSCCNWFDECDDLGKCKLRGFELNNKDKEVSLNIGMLNPDIGLYYNFSVDPNGRPEGCPGMDALKWVNNQRRYSDIVECPINTLAPVDDTSGLDLGGVIDLYADDNVQWVTDFMDVFQKMIRNKATSLVNADSGKNDAWWNFDAKF